jgi:hypothetical protein
VQGIRAVAASTDQRRTEVMNAKRITLAIAILSTVATLLGAVEGVFSPTWALVIATLGSGAYGLVRTLQKLQAGATLKSVLSCTENWGAALVWLGAAVSALLGVVPVEHAGALLAVSAVLSKVLRMVQVAKLDTVAVGAIPASEAPTVPTLVQPPKGPQK